MHRVLSRPVSSAASGLRVAHRPGRRAFSSSANSNHHIVIETPPECLIAEGEVLGRWSPSDGQPEYTTGGVDPDSWIGPFKYVRKGDEVEEGQVVTILRGGSITLRVSTPKRGTIDEFYVLPGQVVPLGGRTLMRIRPHTDAEP